MAAINDDPDTVMQFMQQLSTNLYSAIGDKMKSTDLSSAFTIYNDKQMKTEYTNYTKTIKEWEKKSQIVRITTTTSLLRWSQL